MINYVLLTTLKLMLSSEGVHHFSISRFRCGPWLVEGGSTGLKFDIQQYIALNSMAKALLAHLHKTETIALPNPILKINSGVN